MPRTTNHVVMSFDSDHKLLMNVRASGVRRSPVTVKGRTIVGGTVRRRSAQKVSSRCFVPKKVERAEAEAGLVQWRWKFQQAVEKSPMQKVLSEKW